MKASKYCEACYVISSCSKIQRNLCFRVEAIMFTDTLGCIQNVKFFRSFINFRGSNLTRILQSSLGGNARTVIICNVTPAEIEQTYSTLNVSNGDRA